MYTKVFRSIYDGTLADNWQAMVTFQQMLILADSQGVVDMTPSAMARITGIPLDILASGIAALESPDPASRTADMEGRRIARLDAHRDWGWFLVNFAKYRAMQSREEKKSADRERMREKRSSALAGGVIGMSCEYCGSEATGVDHITPTSAGGPDADSNVVACCLRCNASKNSRDLLTFLNDPLSRADSNVVRRSAKLMERVSFDDRTSLFVASCRQLSPVVADVAHTNTDVNTKAKSKEEEREKPTAPPAPSARRSAVELQTWIDSLPADEQPIPGDDPIIDYAEKVGIPYDFLLLAWEEFCERMQGKRQKDWRAHYRNAVRSNWFKLWWMRDGSQCELTTQGEQAKRRHGL